MIKDSEKLREKFIQIKDKINGEKDDKILIFEEAICDLSIFYQISKVELSFKCILYIIEEIL